MSYRAGIISDTHNLLRPEAIQYLSGSDVIIHAGDIGSAQILEELKSMAPTFAVRGNMDKEAWATELPQTDVIEIEEILIYLIHDLSDLDLDPDAAGIHAVVFGHSHQPEKRIENGILYFNPGSAGPKRFKKPVSIGSIMIDGTRLEGRIVTF